MAVGKDSEIRSSFSFATTDKNGETISRYQLKYP